MNLVVFEDSLVTQLFPITTGRLAYAVNCGGFRLIDWLRQLDMPIHGQVRSYMDAIQQADFSEITPASEIDTRDGSAKVLLVNARAVPCQSTFRSVQELARSGAVGVVLDGEMVAAAVVPSDHAILAEADDWDLKRGDDRLADLPELDNTIRLIEFPHDLIRFHIQSFDENIQARLQLGSYTQLQDGVFVGKDTRIADYVVFDTSAGPILIDDGASIGPYSFLSGPIHIGPGARILEHASIKDKVALSHTTKIGGEIECSIIEPYTNKQHHGFLGHSYLGSWVNLGAGTCNSDLKNTYGEVKMEYRGRKVSTGMQFIGCLMGDYAKSAINSGIFTGKTVGSCSMLYGFITTNVPSFVNYARTFGQISELLPEIMVSTQKRMFDRRNVEQRPCDIQLIQDMYRLTADERQLAGEPLSL